MSDSAGFGFGDLVTSIGSTISDTAGTFTNQILGAAQNKALTYSQSIVNNLSKSEQDTSKSIGVAKPTDLITKPAQAYAGAVQNAVNNLFGANLSTGQVLALGGGLALLLLGLLWTFTRS